MKMGFERLVDFRVRTVPLVHCHWCAVEIQRFIQWAFWEDCLQFMVQGVWCLWACHHGHEHAYLKRVVQLDGFVTPVVDAVALDVEDKTQRFALARVHTFYTVDIMLVCERKQGIAVLEHLHFQRKI